MNTERDQPAGEATVRERLAGKDITFPTPVDVPHQFIYIDEAAWRLSSSCLRSTGRLWPPGTTATSSRAVENRVAMIKADVAFDSAIVDPYGRILARAVTPEGGAATLVADVPLGTADTPAIRLGDWVGWLGLVGMVVFVVVDIITGSGCERRMA